MLMDFVQTVKMTDTVVINGTLTMSDGHGNISDHMNERIMYYYDVSYRAKMILSRPQNILILILGTIAIVTNLFSILAISKMSRTLTSHYRLILNLAISDVLIGISLILFLFINAFVELFPIGEGPEDKRLTSRCLFCFSKALNNTGLAITLLNLLTMAVDHYIAIMRPLHYGIILSNKRSRCVIMSIWIIAFLLGFSDFFSAYPTYRITRINEKYNFCEFIHMTKYNEEYTIFVLSLICFISMLFIYVRIYMEVSKYRMRITKISQDIIQNKRAIATTLLILGSFIFCWLPMSVFSIVLIVLVNVNPELVVRRTYVLHQIDSSLFLLLLLNVIADPIIYAIRVKEVQFGYKRLFCPRSLRRQRSCRNYEMSQYTAFLDRSKQSMTVSNKDSCGPNSMVNMIPEINIIEPID